MLEKSTLKLTIKPTHDAFSPDLDCAFFVNDMRTRNFLANYLPDKGLWLIYLLNVPKKAKIEVRRAGLLINNNVIPHRELKGPVDK